MVRKNFVFNKGDRSRILLWPFKGCKRYRNQHYQVHISGRTYSKLYLMIMIKSKIFMDNIISFFAIS